MNNPLHTIESDEVIIYQDVIYSFDVRIRCLEIFKKLVSEGKLEGDFKDNRWMGYSDIKKRGLHFNIDKSLYETHVGKEFGISYETMSDMIRCYVIYCIGVYVFTSVADVRLKVVRNFLTKYKDKDFRITVLEKVALEDFLGFIGTPMNQIVQVLSVIRLKKYKDPAQRKLAPIINYLAIENEINSIIRNGCDIETFIRWFPIYFWVNITFILPLRATEMMVTPKDCILRDNGKVYLTVRRTKLKKGKKTVYYDVNKDYKKCKYEIPDLEVARNIERYIELTNSQERRFLFVYNEYAINKMLSLISFNILLETFIKENIIGNRRYDFAKYATGIEEFEVVTAGDSRHIALSNLYFQKAGQSICMELADHMNISTSSGYYGNISETLFASSVIQIQKRNDLRWRNAKNQYERGQVLVVDTEKSVCTSKKRVLDDANLDDCIEQDHLAECMGCPFYLPTKKELDSFINIQKKRANESAQRVVDFMNKSFRIKNKGITLEEVFLSAQTEVTRFKMGCDIVVEEKYKEWQKLKNSQKNYY